MKKPLVNFKLQKNPFHTMLRRNDIQVSWKTLKTFAPLMQVSIKFVEELVVIKQMFGAFSMMQRVTTCQRPYELNYSHPNSSSNGASC